MSNRLRAMSLISLALAPALVLAQTQPPPAQGAPVPASSITTLAQVNISGVQPGPGLWKVSRGDHVMWILGVTTLLPKDIRWQSDQVEQAIAGSQQVLEAPRIKFKADIGFFGKLFLLPAIYSARKNPDDRTLQQLVPAADYARWKVLKAKYIGDDSGIERWRPIFAALELGRKALKANGLSTGGAVTDSVRDIAEKHQVPVTKVRYEVKVNRPRDALKAFTQAGPDDIACFHHTITALMTQLPVIRARANAWATGDIAALRSIKTDNPMEACKEAVTEAGFASKLGLTDLPVWLKSTWLAAALKALKTNHQTFAVLPMDQILPYNGYLAVLKSNGYTVTPPDEDDDEEAPAGTSSSASAAAKP